MFNLVNQVSLKNLYSIQLSLCIGILVFSACDDETTKPEMAGGEVTSGEVTSGEVTSGEVTSGAVTSGEVTSGEVTSGEVTSGDTQSATALKLSPRETLLLLREGIDPPSQSFTLSLVSANGEEELASERATWRLSNGDLGILTSGIFNSNGTAGESQVYAEFQAEEGSELLVASATIRVSAAQDVVEEGVSSEAVLAFDQAETSSDCSPLSFIYPEPFTTIPLNLQGFTFQWNQNTTQGPYLVTAQAGDTELRWFTNEHKLTPEGIAWESAKVSGPNGLSSWTISYLTPEGLRCDGASLNIIADPSQLIGAVYYWSTTDSGIMRLAAGETSPEPLLTPQTAPEINCPACHALSRDGSRIAFTRTSFPPFGELAVSATINPRMLNYDPSGVVGYFPSFSPDPNVLIAGNGGRLVIMDSNNGMELDSLSLPENTVGGSPDWSWQGDRITATVGPVGLMNPIPDVGISSGSIYEWVQQNGQWGTANELITPQGDTWNTNPAYSPEGRFIAYNVEGPSPNMNGDGMGNPNIELWIKRVGDSSAPIRLDKANRGSLQGNSWPKWSPYDRRGKIWLAFSSTRDYGHQLIQDGRQAPLPQIWVTAIDLDAPEGQDPSSPAFWLPYQSLNSGNHIPYWAPYEKQ